MASVAQLPTVGLEVLEEFQRATGYAVVLREADTQSGAGSLGGETVPVELDGRRFLLCVSGGDGAAPAARFLALALARALRHDAEIRDFSGEIADRYEEITLLYSISEILGSTISLGAAARTILSEVVSILGARRATLWVYDTDRQRLDRAAVVGDVAQLGPIDLADTSSVTAGVFREGRPLILAAEEERPRSDAEPPHGPRGPLLSVPVSYTPPEGEPRTVGVINVTGPNADETFSAGDLKLLSAIASQIGAAVENNRLISATLRQERLDRELELAHDLQLKLLPPLEPFQGYAEVAARCVPAESVGGDFYHLFRLPAGRLGVMIGDVSSHGFGAALIMALAMSAVAIHAGEGDPPAEVLRRVHHALIDELTSTEMYLTLFYGVVDPRAGTLAYANAGHPYAFRVGPDGEHLRLAATSPPLGIIDLADYRECTVPWEGGRDLLFLFTDGLSDALGAAGRPGEEVLVEEVARGRGEPAAELLDRLFGIARGERSTPADDRTAVLARI